MRYRSEIDGLRAIAVVPVILFHGDIAGFDGGFVGVDVFFVISGYLITSLILQDLQDKKFSILHFYDRRARRILPALFFMMTCSLPFAWFWMMPDSAEQFARAVLGTVLFVSNIVYWQSQGYFAPTNEINPLLHTWSLAVEEQFYLIFPLFLIFLWRFGPKRTFGAVIAVTFLSFALSEWGWRNKPEAAFYLAPTRAWELLAGSICAFILNGRDRLKMRGHESWSIIGLAMILISIIYYNKEVPFPSAYALMPVGGVVLILLFTHEGSPVWRLLSWKPFVGIGLISYSAYLWHQPLMAFARLRMFTEPSQSLMLILSALSLVCGWFSWRFVERPFRAGTASILKTRYSVFFASGVAGAIFLFIGVIGIRYDGRNANSQLATFIPPIASPCDFTEHPEARALQACIETLDNRNLFVLIGDSHAASIAPGLREELDKTNADFVSLAMPGCFPIPGLGHEKRYEKPKCEAFSRLVYRTALSLKPQAIIMAARWTMQMGGGGYESVYGYRERSSPFRTMVMATEVSDPAKPLSVEAHTMGFISNLSMSSPVFVIGQVPEVGINVTKLGVFAPELLHYPFQSYVERNRDAHDALSDLNKISQNIGFFNPSDVFCADGLSCVQADKQGLFYSDDDHLSIHGSRVLAIKAVPEIMKFISID